jgi:hypothetical protein
LICVHRRRTTEPTCFNFLDLYVQNNLHFRFAFPRSSGTSGDLMLLSAGYTRDLLIFSSGKYYGETETELCSSVAISPTT